MNTHYYMTWWQLPEVMKIEALRYMWQLPEIRGKRNKQQRDEKEKNGGQERNERGNGKDMHQMAKE